MNSHEEQWIACGNQWIIEETHEVQNKPMNSQRHQWIPYELRLYMLSTDCSLRWVCSHRLPGNLPHADVHRTTCHMQVCRVYRLLPCCALRRFRNPQFVAVAPMVFWKGAQSNCIWQSINYWRNPWIHRKLIHLLRIPGIPPGSQ